MTTATPSPKLKISYDLSDRHHCPGCKALGFVVTIPKHEKFCEICVATGRAGRIA